MSKRLAAFVLGVCLAASMLACGGDAEIVNPVATGTSSGVGGGTTSSSTAGGTETSSSSSGTTGSGELTARRVFASSKTFTGDLGGVAGADAKCKDAADTAGLGGNWVAWVSDADTSPSARFVPSTVPYVLVDGSEIASSWDDLIDGALGVPIDHDESGTPIPFTEATHAWTGTDYTGFPVGGKCSDFASAVGAGTYGTITAVNLTWAFTSGNSCATPNRIYCFEE